MSLPVVIPYVKTLDKGSELRYSLRSLKNIQNWNGEVIIIGDREDWFDNITHIKSVRRNKSPYQDVENKLMDAMLELPDDFIVSMDDVYITESLELGYYYHDRLFKCLPNSHHRRCLIKTGEWLEQFNHADFNYDIHVPFIVNKEKRIEVNRIIKQNLKGFSLQWRSIYGNVFRVGGEEYIDKKSKNKNLKSGKFISSLVFSPELELMFPKPSRFEK